MAALRTQIYLTEEQRRELDRRAEAEERSLAELIREAVDAYLNPSTAELETVLSESFGSLPDLEVPDRRDWQERERRLEA